MLKAIYNIYKDTIKKLRDLYNELWRGEEYDDIPAAIKVIATILAIMLDVIGMTLLTCALPFIVVIGLFIRFVWKGSFDVQDNQA